MQHLKSFLPLLSLAALVATAHAESSAEAACDQLREGLTRELTVLRSVQDAASAASALPELTSVLQQLASMDRSFEAERALWGYIDNTPGVKQPLIELLQQITIEFMRLQDARFYQNKELRTLLSPQLYAPKKEKS